MMSWEAGTGPAGFSASAGSASEQLSSTTPSLNAKKGSHLADHGEGSSPAVSLWGGPGGCAVHPSTTGCLPAFAQLPPALQGRWVGVQEAPAATLGAERGQGCAAEVWASGTSDLVSLAFFSSQGLTVRARGGRTGCWQRCLQTASQCVGSHAAWEYGHIVCSVRSAVLLVVLELGAGGGSWLHCCPWLPQ